jgi:hypothetical protein
MPAGSTYTPIQTYTATGSQSSITFSSIPSTYTDLILVSNVATAASTSNPRLRFNGDTGTNYSYTHLSGTGSATSTGRESSITSIPLVAITFMNTTYDMNFILHIQNYANTTTNKTVLTRTNKASVGVDAIVGLWRNTAAINSVEVFTSNGQNYSSTSTFTLYGIASA